MCFPRMDIQVHIVMCGIAEPQEHVFLSDGYVKGFFNMILLLAPLTNKVWRCLGTCTHPSNDFLHIFKFCHRYFLNYVSVL